MLLKPLTSVPWSSLSGALQLTLQRARRTFPALPLQPAPLRTPMPTITTPDAPLSTAAGVNGATVDENLINLERGHRVILVAKFPAAFPSLMLCLWTGSMSRGQFLSTDVVSFGGPVQMGVLCEVWRPSRVIFGCSCAWGSCRRLGGD